MAAEANGEAAPAKTLVVDPLGFMDKLSETVYVYRPQRTGSSPSSPPKAPRFVIVFAWMGARPLHIAKYLAPYRDGLVFGEDPADRPDLLLVRCNEAEATSHARAVAAARQAAPVVRAILGDAALEEDKPGGFASLSPTATAPDLLVHIFSNGGSLMLSFLYDALDPTHRACLPAHVTVFDSCPAKFHYRGAVTAYYAPFVKRPFAQQLVLLPAIHVLVAALFVRTWARIGWASAGEALARLWKRVSPSVDGGDADADASSVQVGFPDPWQPQNDRSAVGGNRRELRRAYLYSPADKLIPAADVEQHAAEARAAGFTIAAMESFPGSAHVAHARTDGPRYWAAVKALWAGKP